MFTLVIVVHREELFCIGSHAVKVDVATCKSAHWVMPLVAIGLVIDANALPPVLLIVLFESHAVGCGNEFRGGVAR